jgi:hypothetical protein
MTRHKHAQTGLVIPSPLDRWINATLRVFAMLVLNVASTLQMICRRTRVNATRATPSALPQAKTDTQSKEQQAAPQSSQIALILRSAAKLRVSKDEGVLTGIPVAAPTPSVSLGSRQAIHLPHTSCDGGKQRTVATKGTCLHQSKTGGGGSPRLRGETEGAPQHARSIKLALPHLRSSRRKSGPRASRVICVQGLHTQPWIPAFAGTSGTTPALKALN